jgi:hypothetical protein
MLWQRFANGMDIDSRADARMNWGQKAPAADHRAGAEEMRLEVTAEREDAYMRRGLLGCTRDATIICPDRGPGALETKCVFDYRTWMADWNGGKQPPRHHEIQLQQQMFVGDEGGESYRWGVLAAWVAGEVHYFERAPIADLWRRSTRKPSAFSGGEGEERARAVRRAGRTAVARADVPDDQGQHRRPDRRSAGEDACRAARAYKAAKEQESAGKATASRCAPRCSRSPRMPTRCCCPARSRAHRAVRQRQAHQRVVARGA